MKRATLAVVWRVGLLLVFGGCSTLLGIHTFDKTPDDAAIDGTEPDMPDSMVPHDEDHDGFDDTVDHCPHVPNTPSTNPDGDGDGVGDPCDPNPGTTGDHIAEFVTFAEGTGGFSFVGPSPSVANDQLVIDSTTSLIYATNPVTLSKDIVQMGLTLGTAASGTRQITLLEVTTANLNEELFCHLYAPDASSANFGFVKTFDMSNYMSNDVSATPPLASSATTLTLIHHPSAIDCGTTWPATSQMVTGNAIPFATNEYGFSFQGLHAQIDWIIRIHTD